MKASSFLLLAFVANGFAAPAPSHDLSTPSAVQSIQPDTNHAAPGFVTRSVTADGQVPDSLFRVSISFSEYCENDALKARGWLSNGQIAFEQPFHTTPTANINLHPGKDLAFGPYSYDQHAFKIEYDGCVWTSEGGYPCGWCETQPWSLGPLNCQTGQLGKQRLTYRKCYFVDTHMAANTQQKSARNKALNEDTPSPRLEDVPFDLAPATATAAPNLQLPAILQALDHPTPASNADAVAFAVNRPTVTLMPAIIETHVPNSPTPNLSVILPFHLQIWEYCTLSGTKLAAAVYSNGNMRSALDLRPGNMIHVDHRIPGYASLDIGPFDYGVSRVRFAYADGVGDGGERSGCEWSDDETWKSCAECRAGVWSAEPIDCVDPRSTRVKHMECSVLLGTKVPEEV